LLLALAPKLIAVNHSVLKTHPEMNKVRQFLVNEGYLQEPDPLEEEKILQTISTLQTLVQQYAESICSNVPVQCVIHPYGSYRMGLRTKDGDIDCCILACHHHHTNQEEAFSLAKLATFLEVF
jgi:poly(A) polymerase Pap1